MKNLNMLFEETGEDRPPRAGEWFRGIGGFEVQARCDFTVQSFPILRMRLIELSAPDQCIGCGCTETAACADVATGMGCSWVIPPVHGKGLCSACARTLPNLEGIINAT
jgi:2-keto-3-deoxy-6-phosphogluconate aldolase